MAHLLQITAAVLSLAIAVLRLKVHIEEMLDISSPNVVSQSLCLANDLCTKSLQKSRDQQCSLSDIWSHQMSVVMTS